MASGRNEGGCSDAPRIQLDGFRGEEGCHGMYTARRPGYGGRRMGGQGDSQMRVIHPASATRDTSADVNSRGSKAAKQRSYIQNVATIWPLTHPPVATQVSGGSPMQPGEVPLRGHPPGAILTARRVLCPARGCDSMRQSRSPGPSSHFKTGEGAETQDPSSGTARSRPHVSPSDTPTSLLV